MSADDLLIEELGVEHGAARIDVAIVSNLLLGYEIKSDFDNLDRLARQMHVYHRVFDSLTIVTTESFVAQVTALLPRWWGIMVGERSSTGTVQLRSVRSSAHHPHQDPRSVASMLWRDDAHAFATEQLGSVKNARATRDALYDLLASEVPIERIRERVLMALRSRGDLRERSMRYTLPEMSCLTV